MSDKPERIWATDQFHHVEKNPNNYYSTEYIRADLADAKDQRIKELEAAVRASANIGRILGFLGDNPERISAFLELCGDDLLNEARAILNKGVTK